ncbi:hypothetical protein D5086_012317 [Populus alba]|uniref:Uncharacterized protein n=1 Tax=Populus alba TaxID=43335 RepID=A0ACC4C2B6_POPAL
MFFVRKPITCYFPTDLLRWPSVDGDDGHRHHRRLPDTDHANNSQMCKPRAAMLTWTMRSRLKRAIKRKSTVLSSSSSENSIFEVN